MSTDADIRNSDPVKSLRELFEKAYAPGSLFGKRAPVPSILNALGACAGFAAQVAVWRDLILPTKRNPGDFLVYATTKSKEIFFFGEAINQFLLARVPGRLSFLSLAAASLSSPSEFPDVPELLRHVASSLGSDSFGQPRVPPSVSLPELPRVALTRTWAMATNTLRDNRPAEWPALLGAAAHNIINSNRTVAPPIAVRILLEAAVPMSKLNPATLEQSGVPIPSLTDWSMRALQPEHQREIIREVQSAMPATSTPTSRIVAKPSVIAEPTIAFCNLCGPSCETIAAKDREQIGVLFRGKVQQTTTPILSCDVLFLYCAFEPSGKIVGEPLGLRDLIRNSGAKVAVIASEAPFEMMSHPGFRKSLEKGSNPPVNLVIVGNRNGEAFGRFFKSLFQDMWSGQLMPMAWVKLAPQGPRQPPDIPVSICLMEAGQVVFGKGGLS